MPSDSVGNSEESRKPRSTGKRAADDSSENQPNSPSAGQWHEGQLPGTRYCLVGEVSQDHMGVLLRAIDTDVHRPVAVKVMHSGKSRDAACKRQFLEEARIVGQLQHSGIPTVYEIGSLADGRSFFSMRLIHGETLAERLADRSDLKADHFRLLTIFERVVQAIAYAHSEGFIHRDLHPSNIVINDQGEVQILNWERARCLRPRDPKSFESKSRTAVAGTDSPMQLDHDPEQRRTEEGIIGSASFIPPEQASGDLDDLDERADVFALGAILCELLVGRPPYVGTDLQDLRRQAQEADSTDIRQRLFACGADAELIAIADRCLSVVPDRRFAAAGELGSAIADYLVRVPERIREAEQARDQAETKASDERKRRTMQLAIAANVLMLLTVACVGAWWVQKKTVEESRVDRIHRVEEARREERCEVTLEWGSHELRGLQKRGLWRQGNRLLDRIQLEIRTSSTPSLHELLSITRESHQFLSKLARIRLDKFIPIDVISDGTVQPQLLRTNANARYAAAFDEFGLTVVGDVSNLAWRIRESSISDFLRVALDDWALDEVDPAQALRLDQVTDGVAKQQWREKLRGLIDNPEALSEELTRATQEGGDAALFLRLARLVPEKRVELLEAACRFHPDNAWLHLERAAAYQQEPVADATLAVDACRAALATTPDNPGFWCLLGIALRTAGDNDQAIWCLQRVLDYDPEFVEAHIQIGELLREKGDLAGAAASNRMAVKLDPELARPQLNLAIVLRDQGDFAAALGQLRQTKAKFPDHPLVAATLKEWERDPQQTPRE